MQNKTGDIARVMVFVNTVSTTLKSFSLFSSLVSHVVSLLFHPHPYPYLLYVAPFPPLLLLFLPIISHSLFYLSLPICFSTFNLSLSFYRYTFTQSLSPSHNVLELTYSFHSIPVTLSLTYLSLSFSVPSLSPFLFTLSLNTHIFLTSNFLHSSSSVSENHLMVSPGSWSPSMIAESKARLRALTASDDTRKAK